MQSLWSNEWFRWYISDHFFEMLYFVQTNVLINQSGPFLFSFLVKQTGVNIPEHKYFWMFIFLLFWLESFCDLKWWPVWPLISSVPKESKFRVQHVLHGQIQVQADDQNRFHMPKNVKQYQYHWTACTQKP